MTAANPPAAGRFHWYELMTNDRQKSLHFYTTLFGYAIQEEDMGEFGKYPMLIAGEKPVGGVVTLKPQQEAPPHWLAYVSVDDVDLALKKAQELGGSILMPGTDIPSVGRIATLRDPQGAVIAPYKPAGEGAPEPAAEMSQGEFCWHELLTTAPQKALSFYKAIFGWTEGEGMDMGEMGHYWMFKRGDKEVAGMMKMPPDAAAPPFWLPYIMVDNVDRSVSKAKELGAHVHVAPRDIPEIGRFSVLADNLGASFAVFARP